MPNPQMRRPFSNVGDHAIFFCARPISVPTTRRTNCQLQADARENLENIAIWSFNGIDQTETVKMCFAHASHRNQWMTYCVGIARQRCQQIPNREFSNSTAVITAGTPTPRHNLY